MLLNSSTILIDWHTVLSTRITIITIGAPKVTQSLNICLTSGISLGIRQNKYHVFSYSIMYFIFTKFILYFILVVEVQVGRSELY